MYSRTSNASFVAAWSATSSATSPRQKSLDTTWNGPKCFAANVDLPLPDAPTSSTSPSSGSLTSRTTEHPHLGRRPKVGMDVTHPAHLDLVAVRRADPVAPRRELGAGPLEPVVGMPHAGQRLG